MTTSAPLFDSRSLTAAAASARTSGLKNDGLGMAPRLDANRGMPRGAARPSIGLKAMDARRPLLRSHGPQALLLARETVQWKPFVDFAHRRDSGDAPGGSALFRTPR